MRKGGLFEPLVLLAADAANGLEFDSVVVVEPGVIAGETARGLRTLYVALTRPTQRLSVVHLTPHRRRWRPPADPRAARSGRRRRRAPGVPIGTASGAPITRNRPSITPETGPPDELALGAAGSTKNTA